jgi:hypothetical protein
MPASDGAIGAGARNLATACSPIVPARSLNGMDRLLPPTG